MIIKNGKLLNDSFEFENADLMIEGEFIGKIAPQLDGEECIDAQNLLVLPGFIDTHFHGAVGGEFLSCKEDFYKAISEYEGKKGTTAIAATIEAASNEKMVNAIKFYCEHKDNVYGAKFAGIHLEGPFFNTEKCGAIEYDSIRAASVDELKDFIAAGGDELKIISLAPEVAGAEETIKYAVKSGITISMGHTNATFKEAEKGVEWGATRATHTFNAMTPLNHREPGVAGCAMTNENVDCELICDFYHIHPSVCKLLFDIKGADKIIMVSDSVMSAGLPDGVFEPEAGEKFVVKNGEARLLDGTICGGGSCLIDGIKNMVSMGVSLENAVKAASIVPAKSMHKDDEIGSLKEGKFADVVICDKDLNIKYVFVNGKLIHKA